MILGRSSSGAIKVKSDGDLRAVPCGCCGGCQLTLVHIDENRCEDDIFGIYIIAPNGTERFIQQIDLVSSPPGCCGTDESGNECPQTRIEVPILLTPEDIGPQGEFTLALRLEGTNCCNTYTRFSLNGPGGELFSSYFGQGGITATFNASDACNPAP